MQWLPHEVLRDSSLANNFVFYFLSFLSSSPTTLWQFFFKKKVVYVKAQKTNYIQYRVARGRATIFFFEKGRATKMDRPSLPWVICILELTWRIDPGWPVN